MQTKCPNCNTLYQITQQQIQAANGKVRCSNCQQVFNAIADSAVKKSAQPPLSYSQLLSGNSATKERSAIWASLALVCVLLLLMQLLYIGRNQLPQLPIIGRASSGLCSFLVFCRADQQQDATQFELINRELYAHPNIKNALILNVSFTNRASFSQMPPQILVSMSDRHGKTVAQRLFKPSEYLTAKNITDPSAPTTPIKSGASVSFNLNLVDPGQHAAGFEIAFFNQ